MNPIEQDLLIANFDLDGTGADFDSAMTAVLDRLRAPDETPYVGHWKDAPPHIKARRDLVKSQPGFWRKLPRIGHGFDILGELRGLSYKLNVLTKGPDKHPLAWAEKVEWVKENIGDATITITEDKSLVYGRVLVDDWPDYFLPWLARRPRGLVVCVAQKWNEDFKIGGSKEQPNVFRYDGSNLHALRIKLMRNKLRLSDTDPLPF